MIASQDARTPSEVRARFKDEGFAIRPGVVPGDLIDLLLEALHADIFPSRERFYRQSTARHEANRFTKHGYLENALLDPHDYRRHRAFSRRALELFFCEPLLAEIASLTGRFRMELMQTMIMDANPGTPAHQDRWYPETVPGADPIAAWIALEDIDERAGRFYVIPRSQSRDLLSDLETLTHREWLARLTAWRSEHEDGLVAPALKKGDVLFWSASTIHGSLSTQDGRFSRKSATAHYIPEGAVFGNPVKPEDRLRPKEYRGMRFHKNQRDHSRLHVVKSAVRSWDR